jgi:tetratricopeptide (TPR) repeat protein
MQGEIGFVVFRSGILDTSSDARQETRGISIQGAPGNEEQTDACVPLLTRSPEKYTLSPQSLIQTLHEPVSRGGTMRRQHCGLDLVLIIVFASVLLLSPAVFAQTRGLYGQVTNNMGEPVPGVTIHLTQVSGKGGELTVKADKQGEWIYMGLANVAYRIIARAPGYQPSSKSNVGPSLEGTRVDIIMIPGDLNGQVIESSAETQKKVAVDAAKTKELQQASKEIREAFSGGTELVNQGKYQEAVTQFSLAVEKAANMSPRVQAGLLANLADAQWKAGQKSEALLSYDKAIAVEPNDPTLWVNRGTVLNDLGKTAEAQESFKKAMELNPGQKGQGFYNIGIIFLNAGQTKEATAAFRQSIEVDSAYAESYFELARCLLGDNASIPEAIKNLEQYLKIGKDPQNLQTAKEILSAIKK